MKLCAKSHSELDEVRATDEVNKSFSFVSPWKRMVVGGKNIF